MIREIIFILILFFITGCGMSGSKTTEKPKEIPLADNTASNDLNSTDSGTQIATTESEESILPQTFSIAFPSILKKDAKENNFSSTNSENNQTEDLNTTVSDSNETEDSNTTISDNNETEESNSPISESNETASSENTATNSNEVEESNSTHSNGNETAESSDSSDTGESNSTVSDSNETAESNNSITNSNIVGDLNNTASDNNQTNESNSTTTESNNTAEYCDENRGVDDNKTDNVAYDSLKDKVAKIERVVKISQVNLTVLEKTMPQILITCEGIDFNTTCLFEEGNLSVVMDNETRVQLSSTIDENNITFPDINESGVSLGEVIYRKYNDDTIYEYGLSHEMSAKETNNTKKELYTFKWSDNKKDTLTQYSYEDNITSSNVSIHYLTGEDDKELMHVTFINNSIILGKKETMNLTLVKKGDENGSFSITSNSIEEFKDGNETNTSRFSSNGDISEDSSLLLFSGSVSSENNATEEERTTTLQDNRIRCNVKDEEDSNIELYELNITDGNLENGEYLLFPPDTIVKELTSLEIYEESIGSFTVDDNKTQGGIRGDSYEDILNELIIIKLLESQELINMFKIVDKEDRPDLKIIKY